MNINKYNISCIIVYKLNIPGQDSSFFWQITPLVRIPISTNKHKLLA